MRKVLSFVLVLALVLGSVSMAFAATPSDVVGTENAEAVNVLMEFGVVTGYPDGSFKPGNVVTRAEMAAFIIRALGLNPNASATTQFTDVPASHWASNFVAYAASLGVIYGRTATIFDPNATVSYDEAVTMLVRALGYTEASLNGVYPAAYVSKAKSLGIIGDIQAGTAGANRGDIAKLVFNTLGCTMGKVDANGTWIASDDTGGVKDTMMIRLGANDFSPTGATTGEGDAFIVTTEFADNAVANIRSYVGSYVTAYANSDNDIIAINEIKSTFLTGDFDAAGKEFEVGNKTYKFSRSTWSNYYDESTKTVLASLYSNDGDIDATTIGSITNSGKTFTLAVNFTGNYIKDVYSVIEWDPIAIEQISEDEIVEMEDDLALFGHEFPTDNDDEIDMNKIALYGAKSLSDINEDDIVTIYLNSDNEIGKLEVGTVVIEGTVSRITGGDTFTVAGSKYSWANNSLVSTESMDVTDEVTLWLDYNGDIAVAEVNTSAKADTYGIILEYDNGVKGTFGSDAEINLFLADGSTKVFKVDADEIADANIITTGSAWDWITTASITAGALVKYGLDADGVIVSMEYQSPHADSVLLPSQDEDVSARGYYLGKKIDTGVVVFTYDNSAATLNIITPGATSVDVLDTNDEMYGTGTYDALLGAEKVRGRIFYDTDSNTIVAMLIDADSTSSEDAVYAMYNSEFKEDNNTGYGGNLLKLGDKDTTDYVVTKGVYDDANAATSGGILKLVFNTLGEIKDVEVVSAGTTTDTTFGAATVAASSTITSIKISNNVATFTVTGASLVTSGSMFINTSTTSASILLDMAKLNIYKYDSAEDEWVKGTRSDFTKTNIGVTASKVYGFYDLFDNDGVADTILIW